MLSRWDVPAILTTLFMVGTICYWITRSPRPPLAASLGRTKTLGAAVLLASGFCTSFLPIAQTKPPVLDRESWSALDILTQLFAGKLPLSPVAFDIGLTYVLMLLGIAALFLAHPRKPLLIISLLGIICSSWALQMGHSALFDWFTRLDGSLRSVGVTYGPAMYAMETCMSVLLLISIAE